MRASYRPGAIRDIRTIPIVLFGLLVPAVILASNVRMMPPLGYIDPWLYVSAFLQFDEMFERFGPTYYITRLPWIGLGRLMYAAFPPLVAQVALGFIVAFGTSLALYSITRRFYHRNVATFVAAVSLTNPLFLFYSFIGHPSMPSIAISLCGVALLVHSEGSRFRWRASASGAVLAVAVATHVFSIVVYAPAALAWFALQLRDAHREAMLLAVHALLGCSVGAAAIGLAGYLTYGDVHFFDVQFRTAQHVVTGGWHRLAKPLQEWTPHAGLVLVVALGSWSVLVLLRDRGKLAADRGARFLMLYVALVLVVFLVTDFGLHGGRLQHPLYYVFLLVPSLLLLGPLVRTQLEAGQTQIAMLAYLTIWGITMLAARFLSMAPVSSSSTIVISALALAAIAITSNRGPFLRTSAVVFMALVLFVSCSSQIFAVRRTFGADQWTDFSRAVVISQMVHENVPADRDIWFFYKSNAHNWLFNAVNSIYMYGYSLLSNRLPNIEVSSLKKLRRASSVVLLTDNNDDMELAMARLESLVDIEGIRQRQRLEVQGLEVHFAVADLRPFVELD